MSTTTHYSVDSILKSLGYVDPMMAARQQARMILLGRHARYQAEIQRLKSKWGVSFIQMQQKYHQEGTEDFGVDDDYMQWQWYVDATKAIDSQLKILTAT